MSVYTPVDRASLEQFLEHYLVGRLVNYQGISAGIENSNFFVTTTEGQFVLTLFETVSVTDLPYFLDLMAYFSEHGLPSAHPVADRSGNFLQSLLGKPAALVQRLEGGSVMMPTADHCRIIGKALAHLHLTGLQFGQQRDNSRGGVWRQSTVERLQAHIGRDDRALLDDEMRFQSMVTSDSLPKGVIHADLFRDNALFIDLRLTGIIDFYYACNDCLLYDVAVTVNDWCSEAEGGLNPSLASALLSGYRSLRPWDDREQALWPSQLRAAALRFWLSRLCDAHFPRQGEMTHRKDPDVFKRILLQRRQVSPSLVE